MKEVKILRNILGQFNNDLTIFLEKIITKMMDYFRFFLGGLSEQFYSRQQTSNLCCALLRKKIIRYAFYTGQITHTFHIIKTKNITELQQTKNKTCIVFYLVSNEMFYP